ncbi:hypothetical protein GGR28_002393 [Lewinella aquimaris]|uniref:Tetratricopeptide repeat protein n=1 Tax=Neolewinella aquimaris TaxID=1835722 RepID=A0A840EFR3_9BACT|nr:hypothetical protein [Neolewinella aquimaris]MBB4079766.1 hypothetical protein [Neolewinella aquimaris]
MSPPDNLTPKLLADIEAYYDGELSATDAGQLRAQLAQDEALSRAAAYWEAVHRHGLYGTGPRTTEADDELRKLFHGYEADIAGTGHPASVVRKLPARRSWLVIAAAVLLLLAAGWWLVDRPDPAARLAEENFVWLKREGATLGPKQDAKRGLRAYDRYDYESAYPLIITGVEEGVLDSLNLLYAGVAAFGAGEPERARDLLRELLDSGHYSSFDEAAVRYYLALAELRLGNVVAAREQLAIDAPADPEFLLRRKSLLQRMNELK